jgi:hypothetical protein
MLILRAGSGDRDSTPRSDYDCFAVAGGGARLTPSRRGTVWPWCWRVIRGHGPRRPVPCKRCATGCIATAQRSGEGAAFKKTSLSAPQSRLSRAKSGLRTRVGQQGTLAGPSAARLRRDRPFAWACSAPSARRTPPRSCREMLRRGSPFD